MSAAASSLPDRPPTAWGARTPLTLGLLLTVTLVAFEALAVATILPEAQRELGNVRLYGWAFSGFFLAGLVGIAWAGEQIDAHGAARPFVVGIALFAAGIAVAGAAQSMPQLVLGRAIQGLGAGAIPAIANAAIGRAYAESVQPRLFALLSTAWVVPGLAGPGLAALVASISTWRLVFLGLLPFVAVATALTLPALRSVPPPAATPLASRRSVLAAALLAAGVALVMGAFTAPVWWLTAPLAVAGALVTIPALRAVAPAGSFRAARGLASAVAGMAAVNFAFFGADAYIPYALTTVRGQPTLFAGVVLTLATLGWTAGSWLADRFSPRWGRGRVIGVGLVLIAGATAAMALVALPAVPAAASFPIWAVAAVGMGICYPTFTVAALGAALPGREGEASAAVTLGASLGSAVGAGLGGVIVAAGAALDADHLAVAAVFLLMAAVALASLPLAARTAETIRKPEPHGT